MDTISAFAMGQATRGNPSKVFDWLKAAEIIREKHSTDPNLEFSAGLLEDLEWTEGPIFRNGEPIPPEKTYTYLASTWATPVLWDGEDWIECFRMEDEVPDWDAGTYWPSEALQILKAE